MKLIYTRIDIVVYRFTLIVRIINKKAIHKMISIELWQYDFIAFILLELPFRIGW